MFPHEMHYWELYKCETNVVLTSGGWVWSSVEGRELCKGGVVRVILDHIGSKKKLKMWWPYRFHRHVWIL